jgi:hypothetical protein
MGPDVLLGKVARDLRYLEGDFIFLEVHIGNKR